MRVGEVSEGNGMGWLSEMRGVRVGFKVYIYIYIWFFGNFRFNRVRVGFKSKFKASFIKT